MKWPKKIGLLRHGQSAYNILREEKAKDPEYAEFVIEYEKDYQSPRCIELATKLWHRYHLKVGDWNTPVTPYGFNQAVLVGEKLPEVFGLPDTVLLSPHDRTEQTFAGVKQSWPELEKVKVVREERLCEQSHGLAVAYNDWRIFNVLNPIQKILHDQEGPYMYRYPQGENVPDVRARLHSLIGTFINDYSEKSLLIVSHHLTILSFMAAIGRWDQQEFIEWDEQRKPINCGLTIFKGNPDIGNDGKLELVDYNLKLY